MDNTTPPPPQGGKSGRRILARTGWAFYCSVLLVIFLLAALRFAGPLLLEPLAKEELRKAAATLSSKLGSPVEMGFDSLQFNIGLEPYLSVANPHFTIGGNSVFAEEAAIAVYSDGPPTLIVHGANIVFRNEEAGDFNMAGFSLEQIEQTVRALQGTSTAAGLAPTRFLLVDSRIAYRTQEGVALSLSSVDASVQFDLAKQLMHLSFGTTTEPLFNGTVDLPFNPQERPTVFYFKTNDIGGMLPRSFGVPVRDDGVAEAWGSYLPATGLEGLVVAQGTELLHGFELPPLEGSGVQDGSSLLTAGAATVTLELNVQDLFKPWRRIDGRWSASAADVVLYLPDGYLGAPLTIDLAEASGDLSQNWLGWGVKADQLLFRSPAAVGSVALELQDNSASGLTVSLSASAPEADVAQIAQILPTIISERGVKLLREDLQVERAQLLNLKLQGSDFSSFPWKDDPHRGLEFVVDFFGATLDYADGYPLIENAQGSFGIFGHEMAVTVTAADIGPATVHIGRAFADDLSAPLSTLFVTIDAGLGDGALAGLLGQLPATKPQADPYLNRFGLRGEQHLDLALVVPLDSDDPVQAQGRVVADGTSKLTYIPQLLDFEQVRGEFQFNNDKVWGIATGKLLGAGTRLSVVIEGSQALARLDGTYDIADALERLELSAPVPLQGQSAFAIQMTDDMVELVSDLRGISVDLPPPLGKTAEQSRPARLELRADRAELDYGDGFAKISIDPASSAAAIALGDGTQNRLDPPPAGAVVRGSLAGLDIDAIVAGLDFGDEPTAAATYPLDIELELPAARLLELDHPEFLLKATVNQTVTLARVEADAIAGQIASEGATVAVSLSRLAFPEEPENDLPDELATIFVDPGELTAPLPSMRFVVDDLQLGDQNYLDVHGSGTARDGYWELDSFTASIGPNIVNASGTTATSGEPRTHVTLSIAISDLASFTANFTEEEGTIQDGSASLTGAVSWKGAINDPHFLSMEGQLGLNASRVVLRQDSSSVKLLNLLSPFTLLETLPGLTEETTEFDWVDGNLSFKDGNLNIDQMTMASEDMNIKLTGSTNLITERNDIQGRVVLNQSHTLATTAASIVNPIVGGILFVFDKVLDAPLVQNLELLYDIKGTWENPEIMQKRTGDDAPDS